MSTPDLGPDPVAAPSASPDASPSASLDEAPGATAEPAQPTGIPTLGRHPERGGSDRVELDALLDDQLAGTLALSVDGRPWVVPLLFARDGDRVLLHGSTGAGALRAAAAGAPVVLTVFALDGVVVAHSTFESSANYRSATVHGVVDVVTGEAKTAALNAFSDKVLPGRTGEVQPMTVKEQAATIVLALPIVDGGWVYKARTGGPEAPEGPTDAWCGVIPLHTVAGSLETSPWTPSGTPVPASVRAVLDARRVP